MSKYLKFMLMLSVFVSGSVVMIYELAGSRVIAPYFGNSITVWTALIGVILGALSIGYYLGGILADKKLEQYIYVFILVLSAILILVTAETKDYLLEVFGSSGNLEIYSLVSALILFAPGSIIMGMVSPYVTRLLLSKMEDSGKDIGKVYAISTAGSITGTFLAGFYLIPMLGTNKILFAIAAAQLIPALMLAINRPMKITVGGLLLLTILLSLFSNIQHPGVLLDIDTRYNRILVVQKTDPSTKRTINYLVDDVKGTQSASYTDSDELVFEVNKFFELGDYFKPNPKKALMIGGGAFSYPKYFLSNNPNATMDVVEINPQLTSLAQKYFRLKMDARLNIINEDGRVFLNTNHKKYDIAIVDVFKSDSSPPFQLTTLEAINKLNNSLNDDGVVVVNIIGSLEGVGSPFLQQEIATYKEVFPQVLLFTVNTKDSQQRQNLILVALKKNHTLPFYSVNTKYRELLSHEEKYQFSTNKILTDDYAPIEFLMRSGD